MVLEQTLHYLDNIVDKKMKSYLTSQLSILNEKMGSMFDIGIKNIEVDGYESYNISIEYLFHLNSYSYVVCGCRQGPDRVNPRWDLNMEKSKILYIDLSKFTYNDEVDRGNLLDAIRFRLRDSITRMVPYTELNGYTITSKVEVDRNSLMSGLMFY